MNMSDRVRMARGMLGMDRKTFCDTFHFSYPTITKWEHSLEGSPDFYDFSSVLLSQGIVCDETWLLTGQGVSPYKIDNSEWGAHIKLISCQDIQSRYVQPRLRILDENIINQCRGLLKASSPEELVLGVLRDNLMSPYVHKGAFVVGRLKHNISLQWELSLIEIESGRFVLRLCRQNDQGIMIQDPQSLLEKRVFSQKVFPLYALYKAAA